MKKNKNNSVQQLGLDKINQFLLAPIKNKNQQTFLKKNQQTKESTKLQVQSISNASHIAADSIYKSLAAYQQKFERQFFVESLEMQQFEINSSVFAKDYYSSQLILKVMMEWRKLTIMIQKQNTEHDQDQKIQNQENKSENLLDKINKFLLIDQSQQDTDIFPEQREFLIKAEKNNTSEDKYKKTLSGQNLPSKPKQLQKFQVRGNKPQSQLEMNNYTSQPLKKEWRSPMSKSPPLQRNTPSITIYASNLKLKSAQKTSTAKHIIRKKELNKISREKQVVLLVNPQTLIDINFSFEREQEEEREQEQLREKEREIEKEKEILREKENEYNQFIINQQIGARKIKIAVNHNRTYMLKLYFYNLKVNHTCSLGKQEKAKILYLRRFMNEWIQNYQNDSVYQIGILALEQVNLHTIRKVFYSWFTVLFSPQQKQIKNFKLCAKQFRQKHLTQFSMRAWLRYMVQFRKKPVKNIFINRQILKNQ